MKIGFLILAHRNFNQLKMLIEILLVYEYSQVIIHVDAKSNELYEKLKSTFVNNNRVYLVSERYKVYWGSFNQIRATLSLIERANEMQDLEYCVLLSGQDLPTKPINELANFLIKNKGKEYLSYFKLPDAQWEDGGLNRIKHFSFDIDNHPYLSNKVNTLISRLQNFLRIKRPLKYDYFGGPNWFNLSGHALKYISQYVKENPDYLKHFKFTRCADEIFIQTILLNSEFKELVISNDLRLIDWGSGPEYPKIWRNADENELFNVDNKFFARKFDEEIDCNIIQKLHQRFANKQA